MRRVNCWRLIAKKRGEIVNDFSNLNHLPTDVKLLVVNGQTVVDKAKNTIKSKEYYFDFTSKTQLKSDYKAVERYIRLAARGRLKDKNKKEFEYAIVRLQTTLDGLIEFYTR